MYVCVPLFFSIAASTMWKNLKKINFEEFQFDDNFLFNCEAVNLFAKQLLESFFSGKYNTYINLKANEKTIKSFELILFKYLYGMQFNKKLMKIV